MTRSQPPLHWRRRARAAQLIPVILSICSAACPQPAPAIECGPNTALVDGECVSTLPPIVCAEGSAPDELGICRPTSSCAPGTHFDSASQLCIADAICGDGTTLDESTGECVADIACGSGTIYDAARRLCVPSATCAQGTELDALTQQCVPVNVCGPGTVRDSVTNLCTAIIGCGPGLVAHQNTCMSPDDLALLDADAVEPVNEQNDPAFGGVPELIALEGANESVVFAGVIGRPVDIDGDGADDQDRDSWSLDATASTALRVRVLSHGLPEPAFRVTGPDGYARESRAGDLAPARELVLPRTGTYVIEITTGAELRDPANAPLTGSPEHRYAAILEEIPFPTSPQSPLPLVPLPSQQQASGTLLDLADDNAIQLGAAAGTSLMWTATIASDGNTLPVLLVFDAQRRFLAEIDLDTVSGAFKPVTRGATMRALDDVIVLFDWRSSGGFDTSFTLTAATLPDVELGAVDAAGAAGAAGVEHSRVLIPGQFGAAFHFSATAGQIITSSFAGLSGSSASATLTGPDGVVDVVDTLPGALHDCYARVSGAYTWAVINESTSDIDVSPAILAFSPVDTGALATGSAPRSFTGADLAFDRRVAQRAFVVVENAQPALLRARASWAFGGMGDLEVFRISPTGALLDRRAAGDDDIQLVPALLDEPALTLVALDPGTLDPPNPSIRDWTIEVALDVPPLAHESEPNDDAALAHVIATLPAEIRGTLTDDAVDTYRLTLPSPPSPSQLLELQVQNLTATNATTLRVLDVTGALLYETSSTLVSEWLLTAADGAGPFLVELEGTGSADYEYVLSARLIGADSEAEPNNALANATALAVGSSLFGTTKLADPDVFALTAPAPLPPGAALVVRARNHAEADDVKLQLLDAADGAVVAESKHEDATLFVPVGAAGGAGPFHVRVEGASSSRIDLYRLSVDVLDGPIEVEPNDAHLAATPLALVANDVARIYGQEKRALADFYFVSPDAPLVDGEAFSIRWHNLLERGDIQVRVFASDQALALSSEDYAGELVFAPVGDQDGFYVSITPDGASTNTRPEPYLLEIERLAVAGEREPNNDAAAAQLLSLSTEGSVSVRAQSRADDPDIYAVAVGAAGTLSLAVSAALRMDDVIVTVRDAATGTELAAGTDVDVAADVAAAAGTVLAIEIMSTMSDANETRVYTLDVASP